MFSKSNWVISRIKLRVAKLISSNSRMNIITTILHKTGDENENETYYAYFYQIARKTVNTKCSNNCNCVICDFCERFLSKITLTLQEIEVSVDCKNSCELEFSNLYEKYNDMKDIERDLYTILEYQSNPELSLKIQKLVTGIFSFVNEYVDYYHSSKNLPDALSHLSLNQQWIVTTTIKCWY